MRSTVQPRKGSKAMRNKMNRRDMAQMIAPASGGLLIKSKDRPPETASLAAPMKESLMDADVIIVGAGPAGLCLARSLSGRQLNIVVLEQQAQADLEAPPFDGREIALTRHSAQLLKDLGLWELLPTADIAPLRDAKVIDGTSTFSMLIGHELGGHSELGWLVSNHLIRQAAWQGMQQAMTNHADITLRAGEQVTSVHTGADSGSVTLASGATLTAKLVVAADSRFSITRRMMGIAAHMHDFGKNMLVCAMTFEKPHDFAAWEWFGYGQTLALLPMNPHPVTGAHRASAVITLPSREIEALMQMVPADFDAAVTRRYANRLGAMHLVSTRHNYPLVAVFPERLVAQRFATVGDAAVGMHPVTAHGFNFGLLSVDALTKEIATALRTRGDIGSASLLWRYEAQQKRATLPLYWMTRLVLDIYTRDSFPAKLARKLILRVSDKLIPFKRSVARSLSGA
jgi:ubiquinone biosynthesis UbiH/UbiF/VisC/COQ6 family hydroxylase